MEVNKIYNEDCRATISKMPNEFIDLIVTSPPYNVDLGNNKYHKTPYDLYNDNQDHYSYVYWLSNIFLEIYSKIVDGGRCCINIGDGKNGAVPTSSDIIHRLVGGPGDERRYIPLTHIIWDKSQVGNRTSWGSFNSPSSPSFPTPFEHILVFCKNSKKLLTKGETDLTKEEFIEWSLALWKFHPETKQKTIGHNAMFPEELPKRCMKMFSWKDALVYDPFIGAGTTAVVAKKLGRRYIGSEISANYCKIAEERIKEE